MVKSDNAYLKIIAENTNSGVNLNDLESRLSVLENSRFKIFIYRNDEEISSNFFSEQCYADSELNYYLDGITSREFEHDDYYGRDVIYLVDMETTPKVYFRDYNHKQTYELDLDNDKIEYDFNDLTLVTGGGGK